MPRFVLLYHACPPNYERASHWDFMLESGDTLCTWAMSQLPRSWRLWHERTVQVAPDCPELSASDRVAAEQLADHRLAYLELEGPLSGDRGHVKRVVSGMYVGSENPSGSWQIEWIAESLRGRATLRIDANGPEWLLEII